MPGRFALLRHELPAGSSRSSHWDLLLERDQACWTWAVDDWPRATTTGGTTATRLDDHRKYYLTYEGPVSGDRGTVARELAGQCDWHEAGSGRVQVTLEVGDATLDVWLQQVHADQWRLTVRPRAR